MAEIYWDYILWTLTLNSSKNRLLLDTNKHTDLDGKIDQDILWYTKVQISHGQNGFLDTQVGSMLLMKQNSICVYWR